MMPAERDGIIAPATMPRVADYSANTAMAAHSHERPSINIVLRGSFAERIGGSERTYSRGFVAFCPAGRAHSQIFGATGARQIIVEPEHCWLEYLEDCKLRLAESPYAGSMGMAALGDRLAGEIRHRDAFSAFAREGLLLEIVAAFGRQNVVYSRAEPPAWLRAVREFLHENATKPISMAQVARAGGRHEIHLAREFRLFFGASVFAYVRWLRVEHAARLLLDSRKSITEIALDCGFSSQSHLCREFRRQLGVTPSDYRRLH